VVIVEKTYSVSTLVEKRVLVEVIRSVTVVDGVVVRVVKKVVEDVSVVVEVSVVVDVVVVVNGFKRRTP